MESSKKAGIIVLVVLGMSIFGYSQYASASQIGVSISQSELLNEKRKGFYHCANCGNKLFASNSKFDSGTGWPSFSEALPGAFKTKTDNSFGMERVEYHCAKCGAHHGHVFNDGPRESGKRFCSNGLCLIFRPE